MANHIPVTRRKTYIYADTNFLQQIYAGGGRKAWDRLLSQGDTLIVTTIILEEMKKSKYGNEFRIWRTQNRSRVDTPKITARDLNKAYPNRDTPYTKAGTGDGIGDASIRLHLKNMLKQHPDRQVQLASGDRGLVNYFRDESMRAGNNILLPHRGVFGFLRAELLEGRITNENYDAYTSRIRANLDVMDSISPEFRDRGETARQVKESTTVWKTGDYSDPRNEDPVFREENKARVNAEREARRASKAGQSGQSGNSPDSGSDGRQNFLARPNAGNVLRGIGIVGDVVEFTQVVEKAVDLIKNDEADKAELLLGEYIGGIGGSSVGGVAAGLAAGAAISATGIGAVIGVPLAIVSVFVGSYLGDAAGREFAAYLVREIQSRQANGETIIIDDIIEFFEDYSDANDLNVEGLAIPKSKLDLSRLNSQTGPWGFVDKNGEFQAFDMGPYYGQTNDAPQVGSGAEDEPDQIRTGLQGRTAYDRVNGAHTLVAARRQSAGFDNASGPDTDLLPDGVRRKLEAQSWLVEPVTAGSIGTAGSDDETVIVQNDMADGTNNEQEPVEVPVPRPRPQLTPVKQGVLKGMPDDERLVLTAEFMALTGRKETDAAEAAMIERMEVQRKMAQDLAGLKAGKLSTVWKETGYPKPVRDVLGEEAFQSFVDDRLEVASIAHASSGLHLLQDADLAGIADGTSPVTPADKNAAALITPKVQAAVAKSARTVLDLRQRTPAEAVLLSGQLGKRKAQFDASFDSGAAVDGDEMAAFLFYLETAQREIGTAEANIEPIPQSWAKQVAARFATPLAGGAAATDRRSREAEIKQQYAELQQSFGPRTDDVIAYSLGRFGGNQATPSGDNRAG